MVYYSTLDVQNHPIKLLLFGQKNEDDAEQRGRLWSKRTSLCSRLAISARDLIFTSSQELRYKWIIFQLFWVKALEGVSLKAILVTLFPFCRVSESLDSKQNQTKPNHLPGNKKGVMRSVPKRRGKKQSKGIHSGWQSDLQSPRKGIKGTDKKFPNKKYETPGMKNRGTELFSSRPLVLQASTRASSWGADGSHSTGSACSPQGSQGNHRNQTRLRRLRTVLTCFQALLLRIY